MSSPSMPPQRAPPCADRSQDREPEPRFTGGPSRGDFGGGGRGGFGGGGGGGYGGGAGGRQLYVSNVCCPPPHTLDVMRDHARQEILT